MTLMGCEVVEHPVLTGMNIAVKSGDKLFVWPDFILPKELKYIEVPTMEELWEQDMKERMELNFASQPRQFINIETSKDV